MSPPHPLELHVWHVDRVDDTCGPSVARQKSLGRGGGANNVENSSRAWRALVSSRMGLRARDSGKGVVEGVV
ncbi:hypothetical protein PC116_g33548 [Phytophthora cactorum]|nr:hypothetical protein PC114_g28786 [Phytophthora cactorum]KAG2947528.1 hypothetical protein PC119_g28481 [Phytophthora cactorum]KAG3026393.1 hypothetical protein PC120_g5915 [Phytophthora cactorum]KAG3109911.1 hypothetical protein C6341_g27933 [Phytophthora cactorum]KAG3175597.1 hypothetical protein PC128_g17625 [Phytophthora cactorum]